MDLNSQQTPQEQAKEIRLRLGKPELLKLQDMGMEGAEIAEVVGKRVLVKTVKPYTYMDELEKSGLLAIPETARDRNSPLPSTGIVLKVGSMLHYTDENQNADGEAIVEEGSLVMFSKHSGTDIGIGGVEDLRILEIGEILCTLTIPPSGVVPVKG